MDHLTVTDTNGMICESNATTVKLDEEDTKPAAYTSQNWREVFSSDREGLSAISFNGSYVK